MNKSLHIFRHEVYTLTSRLSFWLALLGVPLIGFLLYGGAAALRGSQPQGAETLNPLQEVGELFAPPRLEPARMGYIDQAGLLEPFSEGFPQEEWLAFSDEEAARRALADGRVKVFYRIPPDYVESGQIEAVMRNFDIMEASARAQPLRTQIDINLLGDERLAQAVRAPFLDVVEENLAPSGQPSRDPGELMTLLVPYGMMSLFFVAILGSSSLMLSSLAKEKETRVMEVLLLSASPQQFLLGKIAGLGVVGLLQVAVWGGSIFLLMTLSGDLLEISAVYLLPASILAWGLAYFVLGYLLYAAIMAGVGVLVPGMREASQATFVVTLPLMAPFFLVTALVSAPNGGLAVFFSLFPLTAPLGMILRLSTAEPVPAWQLALSLALLAAATLLVIRVVAGMFRAQTMLTGMSLRAWMKGLLRRRG